MEEQITIPKRIYDRLLKDSEFLACLQGAGVDNWEGYSMACQSDEDDE